jgi:meso-butanediol dehydrogenase / (S,S)-butanediol dehydrogenase / diacetyl reductase
LTGKRFEGRAVLATGAGSGIGRAVTHRLASEGAAVFAVDIDPVGLQETARLSKGVVVTATLDLSDPELCAVAVANAVDEFGGLDVLGNIAGIYSGAHTVDVTAAQYHRIMAINLDAPFFLAQAAIPHLLERSGNIINIASNAGLQGVPYSAAYCMSKGGVIQLTRSLATEFVKTALRVNAIAPAGTNTNIATSASFPPDMDPQLAGRMAGLRGLAEPEEVAALFAFVASDEARSITGAIYTLDNGLTAS